MARSIPIVPRARVTLNDLLERVLDKGLILDADIMIVLAGIPLIGVKLRAAIAGMETMERYGLMTDWDHKIREEQEEKQYLPPLHATTRRIPHDPKNR